MTTKTTKEDAEILLKSIQTQFHGKQWFKKAMIAADDLGWCLDLHIDKTAMEADGFKLPLEKNVKICVFNRS